MNSTETQAQQIHIDLAIDEGVFICARCAASYASPLVLVPLEAGTDPLCYACLEVSASDTAC